MGVEHARRLLEDAVTLIFILVAGAWIAFSLGFLAGAMWYGCASAPAPAPAPTPIPSVRRTHL